MIRTRFAPSPTGNLHVGSVRTALYAWAYARHFNGQFILRIEDTDFYRNSEASAQGILDGLRWVGLDWDEGPIYQSDSLARYQEVVQQLLDAGKAYYCLDNSTHDVKNGPYRSSDRDIVRTSPPSQPYVIRAKIPKDVAIQYHDMVKGDVSTNSNLVEDWVLVRSSGIPTYNFAVVIDDMDMNITHVIRGDDHVSNTPKQWLLYQMLDVSPPTFGHIPMILDSQGKKLSKRTIGQVAASQSFPVNIEMAQEQGLCPSALLNYMARLGWSKDQHEVFDLNTFVELFDGTGLQSSAARVDPKKLHWLNVQHLKKMTNADLLSWSLRNSNVVDSTVYRDAFPFFVDDIRLRGDKTSTFSSDFEFISSFLATTYTPDLSNVVDLSTFDCWLNWKLPLLSWDATSIEQSLKDAALSCNVPFGTFARSVRMTLSDQKVTPPISMMLKAQGMEKTITWLKSVQQFIQQQPPQSAPNMTS